jgi:type II secretory pathway pseudopilin PulG
MPVAVLLIVVIVLFVGLLAVGERVLKAIRRARRMREASRRLTAAAAQGEQRHEQRRAAAEASTALTSVMPAIHELDPRHVE